MLGPAALRQVRASSAVTTEVLQPKCALMPSARGITRTSWSLCFLTSIKQLPRHGGTSDTAWGAAMDGYWFSGETGWKDQEWGSLKVKKLLGCMELLTGASEKLGQPL